MGQNGQKIPGTSLKSIIKNLPDFKEEITLLQHRANQLNVRLECSPKYHPEIAGEGIEYCWGVSKNTYRSYPLVEKKERKKFRQSVTKSLCNETVITKERARLFSRRQRRYMLAYLGLERAKESTQTQVSDNENNNNHDDQSTALHLPCGVHLPAMSCQLIERLMRVFKHPHKCHRNILDQESKFLESVVSIMKDTSSKLTHSLTRHRENDAV